MKILIGCLSFKNLTGSELYVYELAKELTDQGHNVTIVAYQVGGVMVSKSYECGFKVYSFEHYVNLINVINEVNKPDIIHCQHTAPTETLCVMFPNVPKIATIHSELLDEEMPIIHESIKHYIAITPNVKQHIIDKTLIPLENISFIGNPIDNTRFNKLDITNNNKVLLVGSINYLRYPMLEDIAKITKQENKKLIVIGSIHTPNAEKILKQKHIEYYPAMENVEQFVKECEATCGLYYGRTIIEGWMCGKYCYGYDVELNGNIKQMKIYQPPSNIEDFYLKNVVNKITKLYETYATNN
jgi:hypothetical protein